MDSTDRLFFGGLAGAIALIILCFTIGSSISSKHRKETCIEGIKTGNAKIAFIACGRYNNR